MSDPHPDEFGGTDYPDDHPIWKRGYSGGEPVNPRPAAVRKVAENEFTPRSPRGGSQVTPPAVGAGEQIAVYPPPDPAALEQFRGWLETTAGRAWMRSYLRDFFDPTWGIFKT